MIVAGVRKVAISSPRLLRRAVGINSRICSLGIGAMRMMISRSDPIVVQVLVEDRLCGLDEIRLAIDPDMSRRTFYRHWRQKIDPILLERRGWLTMKKMGKPAYRYFTYRRLLYPLMLRERKI